MSAPRAVRVARELPAGTQVIGVVGVQGDISISAIIGELPAGTKRIGNVGIVAANNHIGQVSIDAELPAGTQVIGVVGIQGNVAVSAILAELPAGIQHLGQVSLDAEIPLGTQVIGKLGANKTAVATAINNIRLDDDPTFVNSANIDVTAYRKFMVFIDIDSTLAPTTIRVMVQFSYDGGTNFSDYEQGLFASLFWEDTDTAAGISKCYSGECDGTDMRFRAVAVGTDATNYFDVTVRYQLCY